MRPDRASVTRVVGSASRVFDDPSSLRIYAFDQGEVPASLKSLLLPDSRPDLAIQPGTLQDLAACIRYAGEHDVAVVPRGASTNGMGGAVPHHGGMLLD